MGPGKFVDPKRPRWFGLEIDSRVPSKHHTSIKQSGFSILSNQEERDLPPQDLGRSVVSAQMAICNR